MYLDQLSREALLIVQGRQLYIAALSDLLARGKAWLVARLSASKTRG